MKKSTSQKTCYLHIGAPKTGSTALQKFFSDNRDRLLDHGVLYPEVSLRGYGHHDLAFLISGAYPEWATAQDKNLEQLLKLLGQQLSNHEGDVVLSSENFYLLANPVNVKAALVRAGITQQFVLKIVVYVRRQDEAHESWYNQTVKAQGCTGSFEDSVRTYDLLWDYAHQLGRWSSVFGAQNIIVVPYQQEVGNNDAVIKYFLKLMALPPEVFVFSRGKINISINRDALELQRRINSLPLDPVSKRRFHKTFEAMTESCADDGLFSMVSFLTSKTRKGIICRYARGNAEIAQQYVGGDTLFNDEVIVAPEDDERYAGLCNEKLTYIIGWLMSSVVIDEK